MLRGLAFGAMSGLVATMAMTSAMRRLHAHLPPMERYPLPPREITATLLPAATRKDGAVTALLAHFGYGALTGAIYACLPVRRFPGVLYGPVVWAVSYSAIWPGAGVLTPANNHPARRNGLMIVSHVVWGAFLQAGLHELNHPAVGAVAKGSLRDTRADPAVSNRPRRALRPVDRRRG